MLENRPIISITLGYIIGILMGLYCKISIVFFYICLIVICLVFRKEQQYKFKLISFRRYFRYIKIIFTSKVLRIIIISSIISNSIILYQNNKYDNLYQGLQNQEVHVIGEIISNKKEEVYKDIYKVKVESVNGLVKYKNTYLYLRISKSKNIELNYGEIIFFTGTFKEPEIKRNNKGFDYKEYLKTLKIHGTINLNGLQEVKGTRYSIFKISNNVFLKIKEKVKEFFSKSTGNLLLGLTIGYTDGIDKDIIQDFSNSNISHILAISGMHVGYISICTQYILGKLIGKRKGRIGTAIVLVGYMFITGFSLSVVRASIMAIILLISGVIYRRNDTWNNIFLSFLIILLYNPFLVKSISVLLSFAGTIGILVLQKNVKSITLAATLFIMPIMAISFNTVSLTSLIISVLVGCIIGPVIILSFIFVVGCRILELFRLDFIYVKVLEILLEILVDIASIGSKFLFNKIYVTTPNVLEIVIFYSLVLIRKFLIYCISR